MKHCIILLSIPLLALSCCSAPKRYVSTSGEIQGTFYNITYETAKILDSDFARELHLFDKSLSIFDSLSTISKINSNKSVNPAKDTVFMRVYNRAMQISQETDGAFDITVSPLVKLWGFNHSSRHDVSQSMLDSVLQFVGYNKINISNGQVCKSDPRVQIDANAIAQGYSSDIIGEFLERNGVENYMVEIGGEIRVKGLSPKGEPWRIGITDPEDDSTAVNDKVKDIVSLTNASIGTSGNYHKYHFVNGKKVGHEIDPKTGLPAQKNLLCASIIAPDCISADAYATACMVMGLEKSLALCRKNKDIEGYFVYLDPNGNKKTVCTQGFKKLLK